MHNPRANAGLLCAKVFFVGLYLEKLVGKFLEDPYFSFSSAFYTMYPLSSKFIVNGLLNFNFLNDDFFFFFLFLNIGASNHW